MTSECDRRLLRGRVLVELGRLPEAEVEVARMLEQDADNLDALSLAAKIFHIKGELSKTIACWAQINAQSRRPAATPLGVFSHDASASARGRPSMASAELDRALALFQHGHPAEARALCITLAASHRGTDLQTYKVAVLADAWLAEISGDLASARVSLEELGRERGLEHDHDRLCALVRVYDQIGTPDVLEAAAKICRHMLDDVARSGREKISMLGQLASLERRLGHVEAAAELDAHFVAATRRRMHRASLHDLVRVAAQEYLPLAQLRRVKYTDDRLPAELDRRERALVHALNGDSDSARELFARGSDAHDVVDRCYLAELDSDAERAVSLFLECDEHPDVIGWLLDHHARTPSAAIARHLGDRQRHARILRVLDGHCQLAPQRPETWYRLATLHQLANRDDDAKRCRQRADALATARDKRIGRVVAAGVYHLGGKPKGLLHQIWVHRTPTTPGHGGVLGAGDIHGNVTAELRAAIRNTFISVREYARAKLPHATADLDDYTYSYKLPKEDEQSGGLSAGLPSALAFLSVFLQRPIPLATASSGALISEAHDVISIGRIGEAEHKVRAAYHGNLASLILPLANRGDLERSTLVPHAITSEVVSYAANLDHAVQLAFGPDVFTRA